MTELLHSHTRTRSRIMELPSALPSELPLFSSWSGHKLFPLPSSTSSQPLLLLIMFSGQSSPAWVNPLPMCSVSPSVQPVGLCNVAFYSLIQVLNYVANPLGSDGGTDGSTCPVGFILSTELSYCMEKIDYVFVKQMNRHVSEWMRFHLSLWISCSSPLAVMVSCSQDGHFWALPTLGVSAHVYGSLGLPYILPFFLKSGGSGSVAKSCLTLCDPMDCSTPGFPVLHYLPEFVQTHVHGVSDAIQTSHPLSSPSSPAFNLSNSNIRVKIDIWRKLQDKGKGNGSKQK